MSFLYADRVMETSTTTGTGTYTLAGAVLGYQSFAGIGDGNTCYYCAIGVDGNGNPNGDGWEVGFGTYTSAGTTLARTAIVASTNANAAVNWAAGTRRIFCTIAARQAPIMYGGLCEGRLTTESGVPVSTSDRTAQGTLYWKPCTPSGRAKTNGAIDLWNGTDVVRVSLTQLSLALTITSGKNKNVYIDYNSGTPQIILGADWTGDTTESETLTDQNGLVVLSGTPAYRWVGVIRASGANVTEDSDANRLVWNAYNQIPRRLRKTDSTSHGYNGGYRQWNNTATNQIAFVQGVSGSVLPVTISGDTTMALANKFAIVAFALDATGAPFSAGFYVSTNAANEFGAALPDSLIPGLGYHFVAALESTLSGGSLTFNSFILSASFLC